MYCQRVLSNASSDYDADVNNLWAKLMKAIRSGTKGVVGRKKTSKSKPFHEQCRGQVAYRILKKILMDKEGPVKKKE